MKKIILTAYYYSSGEINPCPNHSSQVLKYYFFVSQGRLLNKTIRQVFLYLYVVISFYVDCVIQIFFRIINKVVVTLIDESKN